MANVQHIVTGNGEPQEAPPSLCAHYLDLDTGDFYKATGTGDPSDWKREAEPAMPPIEIMGDAPVGSGQPGAAGIAGTTLYVCDENGDWQQFHSANESFASTVSELFVSFPGPAGVTIYWTPSNVMTPPALGVPGWVTTESFSMRWLLTMPDVSQPLKLKGFNGGLYANQPLADQGAGEVHLTLPAPVCWINVHRGNQGPWLVTVEALHAPT